jgi:hypothetical protein
MTPTQKEQELKEVVASLRPIIKKYNSKDSNIAYNDGLEKGKRDLGKEYLKGRLQGIKEGKVTIEKEIEDLAIRAGDTTADQLVLFDTDVLRLVRKGIKEGIEIGKKQSPFFGWSYEEIEYNGKAQALAEVMKIINEGIEGTKEAHAKDSRGLIHRACMHTLEELKAKLQSPQKEVKEQSFSSKSNSEDTISKAEVMKIINSIEIDYPDDDGLPFERTAEEFKKELKAKLQETK